MFAVVLTGLFALLFMLLAVLLELHSSRQIDKEFDDVIKEMISRELRENK